ncbi:MAG: hypothetical protein U1G07_27090 [Verrucomicrobiota bacterium]
MDRSWLLLAAGTFAFSGSTSASAAERNIFEASAAGFVGGASKVAGGAASSGYLVALTNPSDGAKFTSLPAASRLAIRYGSVSVGTISVTVNDQPVRKVNVHSSGALTNSVLHAIIEAVIPANATLTISLSNNDVEVNIERIVVGDGDLGLPPDLWNLPPLKATDGPYPADWIGLSRLYGQSLGTADLSTTGARQAQRTVFEVSGLTVGSHTVKLVNRGPGPVAVDALVVR